MEKFIKYGTHFHKLTPASPTKLNLLQKLVRCRRCSRFLCSFSFHPTSAHFLQYYFISLGVLCFPGYLHKFRFFMEHIKAQTDSILDTRSGSECRTESSKLKLYTELIRDFRLHIVHLKRNHATNHVQCKVVMELDYII